MRTTLTLDPDVARLVEEAVHREHRPMKQVVNDALRRHLGHGGAAAAERYDLHPHVSALRPGFDRAGFNRLADELEDEAILDRTRQ